MAVMREVARLAIGYGMTDGASKDHVWFQVLLKKEDISTELWSRWSEAIVILGDGGYLTQLLRKRQAEHDQT